MWWEERKGKRCESLPEVLGKGTLGNVYAQLDKGVGTMHAVSLLGQFPYEIP